MTIRKSSVLSKCPLITKKLWCIQSPSINYTISSISSHKSVSNNLGKK